MNRVVEPSAGVPAPPAFVAVAPRWWVTNLGGLLANGILARRSRSRFLRVSFALGVATHVGEAAWAYHTARRAGLAHAAPRWALQTLLVGFPSLVALHAVVRDQAAPGSRG